MHASHTLPVWTPRDAERPIQVWLTAELAADGTVELRADSDSSLTRGLCAVIVRGLRGLRPAELAEVRGGGEGEGEREVREGGGVEGRGGVDGMG